MKSRLVDGKLIPPGSPEAAQLRQQQLAYEIQKTAKNRKASGNRGWLVEEEKQLSAWMRERDIAPLPPRKRGVP